MGIKKYVFRWMCDAASGKLEIYLADADVELIKAAYRDHFSYLGERSELKHIRKQAIKALPFYNPRANQDIRIFFPEEITKEVDDE